MIQWTSWQFVFSQFLEIGQHKYFNFNKRNRFDYENYAGLKIEEVCYKNVKNGVGEWFFLFWNDSIGCIF